MLSNKINLFMTFHFLCCLATVWSLNVPFDWQSSQLDDEANLNSIENEPRQMENGEIFKPSRYPRKVDTPSSPRRDNPDERGSEFEGDIKLSDLPSSGLIHQDSRWPHGIVPYEIDDAFDDHQRRVILHAMREISKKTCVEFRERRAHHERDYVFVVSGQKDSGCWANLGRKGGRQEVNLENPGCVDHGTTVHELVHALGFHHEQTRPDRDDYVSIDENNILFRNRHNFMKYKTDEVTMFNLPYDYSSIMHYSPYAFAVDNSRQSIAPKKGNVQIGQRVGLSLGDVKKIQLMYQTLGCQSGDRNGKSIDDDPNSGGRWTADLYEDKDHGGQSLHVSGGPGECVNIFYEQSCGHGECTQFNDQTSSIHTHDSCVRLYDDRDCTGASRVFKPGTECHLNFHDCGFNDKMSSIGSC